LLQLLWKSGSQGVNIDEYLLRRESRAYVCHFLPEGRLRIHVADLALQQADAQKLQQLFTDEASYRTALLWGQAVFETYRSPCLAELERCKRTQEHVHPRLQFFCLLPVTNELAAHAAWQRLLAAPGAKAAHLANVRGLVQQAIPDVSERQQLLQWAEYRRK